MVSRTHGERWSKSGRKERADGGEEQIPIPGGSFRQALPGRSVSERWLLGSQSGLASGKGNKLNDDQKKKIPEGAPREARLCFSSTAKGCCMSIDDLTDDGIHFTRRTGPLFRFTLQMRRTRWPGESLSEGTKRTPAAAHGGYRKPSANRRMSKRGNLRVGVVGGRVRGGGGGIEMRERSPVDRPA